MTTAQLKKEIQFRAARRGTKELDMILGGFVRERLESLTEPQLQDLCTLLKAGELDLMAWFETRTAPAPYSTEVFWMICGGLHV